MTATDIRNLPHVPIIYKKNKPYCMATNICNHVRQNKIGAFFNMV